MSFTQLHADPTARQTSATDAQITILRCRVKVKVNELLNNFFAQKDRFI